MVILRYNNIGREHENVVVVKSVFTFFFLWHIGILLKHKTLWCCVLIICAKYEQYWFIRTKKTWKCPGDVTTGDIYIYIYMS